MRNPDEDSFDAEYWDEYLQDFGLDAYMEARYFQPEEGGVVYSHTVPCGRCGEVHPT
jgi:hypothetical protein